MLESAANAAGSSAPVASLPSGLVTAKPAPPSVLAPPTITGTLTDGGVVTAAPGVWAGTPAPTFAYQWQLCAGSCHAIGGARSARYRLTDADIGFKLRVVVTGANATNSVPGMSAIVGPVLVSRALHRRIQSALRHVLTPGGRNARIAALLRHRSYTFRFTAPLAGRLVIDWYYRPRPRAHHRRPRPVLVAVARVTVSHGGRRRARLKLTAKGRALLRHARKVQLQAQATFTVTGGVRSTRVSASRRITVKR